MKTIVTQTTEISIKQIQELTVKEMASSGGKARAAKLTPERRKEIGQKAIETRWNNKVLKATHVGTMKIADKEIICAVLQNGQRVITQDTLFNAIGKKGNPFTKTIRDNTTSKSPLNLPKFMLPQNLEPFLLQDISLACNPVKFLTHNNQVAFGFDANILPAICEAYLSAKDHGRLLPNQAHIADSCNILIRGFARIGIIALVDEATGYQSERDRTELQTILDKYIAKELQPWTRRFYPEFFKEVSRLYSLETQIAKGMPRYIGHFINKYIYKQLPNGVLEELKRVNPTDEDGKRPAKHHQYLTSNIGNIHLDKQIVAIITMMTLSESKEDFDKNFEKWLLRKEKENKELIVDIKSE